MTISEKLGRIQEQIAQAARRARRNPNEIQLMAVSKTVAPDNIREAYAAGQRLFGENRVQEFAGKREALAELGDAQWHMIGHLQSNKAKAAVEVFAAIDSLDSATLGMKLNAAAAAAGKIVPVLLELNVGGEESKIGLRPNAPEIDELLDASADWKNLRIEGLMSVPPYTEDPEDARAFFRVMAQYRDKIAARNLPHVRMDVLSMGMSHDFEVAIEEGSTCVRIGTAIFGERKRA